MERRAFVALIGAGLAMCTIPSSRTADEPYPHCRGAHGTCERMGKLRLAPRLSSKASQSGDGSSVKISVSSIDLPGADAARIMSFSEELVALNPDVIIGHSTPVVAALHQTTQKIPIVFVVVGDPVGSGFVESIARPDGNITGFSVMWPTITGKYLSILRELKPELNRVALCITPNPGPSRVEALAMATFTEFAEGLPCDPVVAEVQNTARNRKAMTDLGGIPGSALIVMPG